jgi:hypothetical protein
MSLPALAPRTLSASALVLALAACAPPPPDGDAPSPLATRREAALPVAPSLPPSSAAPPLPAATAATSPVQAAPATPAVPVVDMPPWPATAAGGVVKLTWVFYPFREVPQRGGSTRAMRHAELVVRVGAVARRIALGDFSGGTFGPDQHVCRELYATAHPGARDHRLAGEIAFYDGGWDGLTVRRDPTDTLTLTAWTASDGLCEDAHGKPDDCSSPRHAVAVVPIPPDATIQEAIVEVEGSGRQVPFEC